MQVWELMSVLQKVPAGATVRIQMPRTSLADVDKVRRDDTELVLVGTGTVYVYGPQGINVGQLADLAKEAEDALGEQEQTDAAPKRR